MRSLINAKISGFRLWIIPEPLVPRQEDRRLGERDCVWIKGGLGLADLRKRTGELRLGNGRLALTQSIMVV